MDLASSAGTLFELETQDMCALFSHIYRFCHSAMILPCALENVDSFISACEVFDVPLGKMQHFWLFCASLEKLIVYIGHILYQY